MNAPAHQMLVYETRAITVVVRDSIGREVFGVTPSFTSRDTSIVDVTSGGVMTAKWLGVTHIDVTLLSLKATVIVRVNSRLRIGLELIADWHPTELAVGDTVRLRPYVSDANGRYLDITPTVTWSSTNPAGVSVDSRGLLTALQHGATTEIRAVGPEGVATMRVNVSVPITGVPATLRVAHAGRGMNPITFIPTKGVPTTLNPGETMTQQVPPGILLVAAQATPNPFHDTPSIQGVTIKPGEKVTLYALGNGVTARLKFMWADPTPVPPDSARTVVVQGVNGYSSIFLRPRGEGPTGVADNCYFDPLDGHTWITAPGGFDLLLLGKFPDPVVRSRLPVEAIAGKGQTLILTGSPSAGMSYFSFPDL